MYVARAAFVIGALLLLAVPFRGGAESQSSYSIAPEFTAVYDSGGGLQIFGHPESDAMTIGGLLVQYFERARFEYHPEFAGTPYVVQLSRLGTDEADSRQLLGTVPFQPLSYGGSDGNCVFFHATGHRLCSGFREFWQTHGLDLSDTGVSTRESLALFGYPISEEFTDPATGMTVQYFERARFEYHPELAGTDGSVQLGLLGNAQYQDLSSILDLLRRRRHSPTPTPSATPTTAPSPAATTSPPPSATATASAVPSATPTATPSPTKDKKTSTASVSIQSMVDAAAPGATVMVPAGIYRETVTITKPITLIGEPGAEIRGSDDWSTGWAPSGSYWLRGTVPNFGTGTWPCASGRQCDWPEQVFIDGRPLQQVASSPRTGQFAVNGARQVVLADDPAGHVVEVTTRQYWIIGRADNVTIRGFTMKHAATPAQQGALSNGGHANWTIEGNTLSDAHGADVALDGASGLRLAGNDISRGGQLGVTIDATSGAVVSGNTIHDNNTEAFSQDWEAGGLKATHSSGSVVSENVVAGNDGAGIWFDMNCSQTTVSNNRVHDNTRTGISYEISTTGQIQGNAVWENSWGSPDTWGSSGILLDDSDNTVVSGNVVAWNVKGITVIAQNRSDRIRTIANVVVRDNTIAETSDYSPNARFALRWIDDGIGMLYRTANGNRGESNVYWYPTGEDGNPRFQWTSSFSRLSDFGATPGEQNGVYIDSATKDSTLSAAGVPTTAISR